jgi:hypothetical protein
MPEGREDKAGVDKRQFHSSEEEIASFRNRRQQPKTITRPPADKMLRPAATRGYETK